MVVCQLPGVEHVALALKDPLGKDEHAPDDGIVGRGQRDFNVGLKYKYLRF